MAYLIDDLVTYLNNVGVISLDAVGADFMPDQPDDCVAIYEYEGATGQMQVAGVLRSLQVVVRGVRASWARNKANELYHALNVEDGILNLTAERWCTVHLRQPPFKLKVDDQKRTYYAFNLGMNTYYDWEV